MASIKIFFFFFFRKNRSKIGYRIGKFQFIEKVVLCSLENFILKLQLKFESNRIKIEGTIGTASLKNMVSRKRV